MLQLGQAVDLVIILAAALVGGMIAHRLRQPVILGYLFVGIVVGPHALGLVSDLALIEVAATIGVALLMFTLGLEVSIGQLRQMGGVGLYSGISQILVTFIIGLTVGRVLFHWSVSEAVLFGLIISLSSTMVCLKILMERGELDSVHGRIMIAILILQDISVVLMMVIVPLLGGHWGNLLFALGIITGKVILFIGIAIVSGIWVLPWLMSRIGGVPSRELFLLIVLVLCLGAALGTYIFGLSVVFGAFLVGLVLRESRFAHQALAEITPLRDVFATLFFVSLGMLLNPQFVVNNWLLVVITVLTIIFLKMVVVSGTVWLFGYSGGIALLAGAGLFQIGEFSFILARAGVDMRLVSDQFYSLILATAIITMLLTPLSVSLASWLSPKLAAVVTGNLLMRKPATPLPATEALETGNPVIIAGYGRIGQNIARGLEDVGIPYTIIEIDPELIFELRCQRKACIYGDASNLRVLSQVNLTKAQILVVTFPDPLAVVTTVQNALRINPKLKIIARVHRTREANLLQNLGVVELINLEYEASFEFIRRVFSISGWEETDVERTLAGLRQDKEIIEFSRDDEEE